MSRSTARLGRLFPPLLVAALLPGCPQRAPGEGAFAADAGAGWHDGVLGRGGGEAGAADGAGRGTVPDGARAQPDSSGTPPDGVGGADTAGASGPCEGGLPRWYTRSLASPQSERADDLAAVPGGGFVLAGSAGGSSFKSQARLSRLSGLGAPMWHRTFGTGEAEDRAEAVVVLADGYALAGTLRSEAAGSSDGWIIRTNLQGDAVWQKGYGGDRTDLFRGLAPAAGGGLVAAGLNRSINKSQEDGWLLRVDKDGALLWQEVYGGSSIDELNDVVADGAGFAAAGENWSQASGGSDAWLLRVDAKGKQSLSKVYGKGDKDWARALVRMPGGGFALAGKASVKGNPKLWVIRTDAQGNMLWDSVQGGNQSEQGWGVAATADGGLLVAGDTNSGKTGVDAWLLRYDPWGNLLWDERYGGGGNQWGVAVLARPDGGSLMAGRAWNSGSQQDVYLVRSGPWGHASCQGVGPCGAKEAADCDDGLVCTVDRCDSIDGCTHDELPDGVSCGVGALCGAGKCLGG